MSLFKKGFGEVNREKSRQEKNRENMGNRIWNFYAPKDGQEAKIRFLNEDPITFYAHTMKEGVRFVDYLCIDGEADCPLCNQGERQSFKSAFLIIDARKTEFTDRQGNKKKSDASIRLYITGIQVSSQLMRYADKYGLTNRYYTLARTGAGKASSYAFDPEDKSSITKEEISNLLPPSMKELYDGSQESIEKIIISQLNMMRPDTEDSEDEEENTQREAALVNIDDLEEEKPKARKLGFKRK